MMFQRKFRQYSTVSNIMGMVLPAEQAGYAEMENVEITDTELFYHVRGALKSALQVGLSKNIFWIKIKLYTDNFLGWVWMPMPLHGKSSLNCMNQQIEFVSPQPFVSHCLFWLSYSSKNKRKSIFPAKMTVSNVCLNTSIGAPDWLTVVVFLWKMWLKLRNCHIR